MASLDINLDIEAGEHGWYHARGRQMRSLMVSGRSVEEIWQDVAPVLKQLFEIQGKTVTTTTIDRTDRRIHVDIE
jgi:hypothetical protein